MRAITLKFLDDFYISRMTIKATSEIDDGGNITVCGEIVFTLWAVFIHGIPMLAPASFAGMS